MTDRQTSGTASAKAQAEARIQEVKLKGNQLIAKVKELIEEGNARRLTIKKEGRTLMEIPLSVGVGGAAAAVALAPTLAAVGAIAALVTDVEILIERTAADPTPPPTLDAPDAS